MKKYNYFFLFNLTNRIMSKIDEDTYTLEECLKWKQNKEINPKTGYSIKKGKTIYKKIQKACSHVQSPIISPAETDKKFIKIYKTKKDEVDYKPLIITVDVCKQWLKNKLKNPFTNYLISEKSTLYKKLENACKQLNMNEDIKDENKKAKKHKETNNPRHHLKRPPTTEECIEWKSNKLRNPLSKTKNTIVPNGKIYKELEKECEGIQTPILKKISEEIMSDKISEISEDKKVHNKQSNEQLLEILKQKIAKTKSIHQETEFKELYYPDLNDPKFNEKLLALKEIRIHKINKYNDINNLDDFNNKANELCRGFDKSPFQYLIAHYLSYRTPYKSLLLYYSVGVGKTCTAITIAEGLLINHSSYDEPKIWIILPGAIEAGFKNQIFDTMKLMDFSTIANQCTGDTYVKLAQLSKDIDIKTAEKRIKKIIKSRYMFFTYEGFANYIEINYTSKNKIVSDKVIIVDEAHNIRSTNINTDDMTDDIDIKAKDITDENKRVYSALIASLKSGVNNKLILLTATPMYNEPYDIYNLFYLLLLNDKREYLYNSDKIFDANNNITQQARKFIGLMSSNYISYLRGKNPFNFAFKLSPKLSGIKILDKIIPKTDNGNPIETIDSNWVNNIEDGVVISKLGKKQLDYLIAKKIIVSGEKHQNNFAALQPMNIVYDTAIGREGFNNMFIKVGTKEQIIVNYNSKYKNCLSPDDNNLGLYSGKFLNIANIIKNTNGIIVIYSKYIWSGIMPFAIILEHMGFSREGTENILAETSITHNTTYENIKYPKYCILSSSNPEIMGNTTIDGLMNIINKPENKDGKLVKVVLMTPVAGEGLNFQNIREMHILESWYHFNRIDQIIGRGIRNCSHKNLPVELRNVTVFLHCSINNYEKETADIHAYRISARKLNQSFIVDEIIRNNALDCSLFRNINYFPKEMFKLGKIDLITSQGARIKYELGDADKYKPVCRVNVDDIKENNLGFREETYKHLALNIQTKLKNVILSYIHKNERFISYQTIKKIFTDVDEKILMHSVKISIYPNIIIDNILLLPHKDGVHIIDVIEDKPVKISLTRNVNNMNDETADINENFYKIMDKIETDNYDNAIISLYTALDEITFKLLISKIFQSKALNKIDSFLEMCFLKEGILITKKEIPNVINDFKYIGFVNIFNEEFEPLLYNQDGINHKSLNPKQLETLKSNRKIIKDPNDLMNETLPWGLMIPVYENKEKKNKINVFKLLTPGIIYGKKTGIVCTSLHKKEHSKFFKDLSLQDAKNTKESYCSKIAAKLYKLNRITLLPIYKPA